MRDYSTADLADATVRRQLRVDLDTIERQAATLDRVARHDVSNAAGAARNALQLLEEGATALSFGRLVEMATRNLQRAADILAKARDRSGGNERDDLGRARQGDDADAVGF
jgi:hypothetical protein